MTKKVYLLLICALSVVMTVSAVNLNSKGRNPQYVNVILKRSKKIVDKLNLNDPVKEATVVNIVANRYFQLNDIDARRDTAIARAKRSTMPKAEKKAAIASAKYAKDAALYRSHFDFASSLATYLTDKQIDEIKDGMTYHVLEVTYGALLDMIPTLKPVEKVQIMAWLKEAREYAIDAGSSGAKHAAFGKFKGRINNYLAKRGYNLDQERKDWYKRIKAREEAKKK